VEAALLPSDHHERFTLLLLKHQQDIFRFVLMFVPHRADAQEIVQETAMALWKNFAAYDAERPFTNWACGFARVEIVRFLRRARRRRLLSAQAIELLVAEERSMPSELEERDRHLRECLARLRADQRTLIEGYYLEERSVETIARTEGRTPAAVYKSLQRIRQILFACVQTKMTMA
jgi:RNA polymerase sigma-70 factor, ECF subfamily